MFAHRPLNVDASVPGPVASVGRGSANGRLGSRTACCDVRGAAADLPLRRSSISGGDQALAGVAARALV